MSTKRISAGQRILFDGGMGTQIAARGLDAPCPELNLISNYDAIVKIHSDYIKAGATIISANTFGANPIKLSRHGIADKAQELTTLGIRAVKEAVAKSGKNAKAALDIGPTGGLLEPFGELTYDQVYNAYKQQIQAGVSAGAELCIIETMTSLLEGKIAARVCNEFRIPYILSYTYEANGRTLMGDTPQACAALASMYGAAMLGTNCSGGPEQMLPIITAYRSVTQMPILCQPNAGLPVMSNGVTTYPYTPEKMLPLMQSILDSGANAIGGCCGTTPAHIALFNGMDIKPMPTEWHDNRIIASSRETFMPADASGIDTLTRLPISEAQDYDEDEPFVIDITGEEPEDIFEELNTICSMIHVPMLFTGGTPDVLNETLHRYNGTSIAV